MKGRKFGTLVIVLSVGMSFVAVSAQAIGLESGRYFCKSERLRSVGVFEMDKSGFEAELIHNACVVGMVAQNSFYRVEVIIEEKSLIWPDVTRHLDGFIDNVTFVGLTALREDRCVTKTSGIQINPISAQEIIVETPTEYSWNPYTGGSFVMHETIHCYRKEPSLSW